MESALQSANEDLSKSHTPSWEESLRKNLPLFGHRNWFIVADSAYPAQSRKGIETIVANDDQQRVVEKVLALLSSSSHVRPIVHLDRELAFVDDKDAPGVQLYREWIDVTLAGTSVSTLPHEEIIARLDRAAETFCAMVIKTNMTIPYTTIFFELDCAYWDSDSEKRLRSSMRD